jgi:hypothetical protein
MASLTEILPQVLSDWAELRMLGNMPAKIVKMSTKDYFS